MLLRRIGRVFSENRIFFFGFLVSVSIVSLYTGFNLVHPFSYLGPHQPTNAWKVWVLDKRHLNPLHYDLALPELEGGRFVSYWDPPLPYLLSLGIAKFFSFLGDDRYLLAVKLTNFTNFSLTYLLFYLTARGLGVGRFISSIFAVFFQAHRLSLGSLLSLNMSGVWAMILPIYVFLRMRKSPVKLSGYLFLGLSLSLAFLQNPYYGAFASVFLSLPLVVLVLKGLTRSLPRMVKGTLIFLVSVILPVLLLKGYDYYLIREMRLTDPQGRNYLTMQAQSYRFWHHFMPYSGSAFENFVNPPIQVFLKWAENFVDGITIWRSEADNPAYLGILNLMVFFSLVAFYFFRFGILSFLRSPTVYFLSFVLGAAVFFRGDIFVMGSRHIVFPWYRLQAISPLTTPAYFAHLSLFLFFLVLAILLAKLKSKIIVVSLLAVIIFSLPDVSRDYSRADCQPEKDLNLYQYLRSQPVRRVFIYAADGCDTDINPWFIDDPGHYQDEIVRDGRYYQIYHRAPIYAPESLSWFDNYKYEEVMLNYRTLESLLTHKNDDYFRQQGVKEVVFLVDRVDKENYWPAFLRLNQRKGKIAIYDTAAIVGID